MSTPGVWSHTFSRGEARLDFFDAACDVWRTLIVRRREQIMAQVGPQEGRCDYPDKACPRRTLPLVYHPFFRQAWPRQHTN